LLNCPKCFDGKQYLIIDISDIETVNILATIKKAFSFSHLTMALYFMVLGSIIGGLFHLYTKLSKKIFNDMDEINSIIGSETNHLIGMVNSESEELSLFIKQIWPTLNKIQSGVNLLSEDKSEMNKSYKNDIISITKDNISSVFSLVEIMLIQGKEKK